MSFNTETPQTIQRRQESEIEMALPGSNPRLANTAESMIARSTSLAAYEIHKHIDEEAKEILPHTATRTLDQHGNMKNVERKMPTKAKGVVTFSGTDGNIVPANTILQRSDNVQFITLADVTMTSGQGSVLVEAIDTGSNGNTPANSSLSLVSPILGIESNITVNSDGLVSGTDIETNTLYRGRIIEQWRQPPHAGALFDYEYWAKQVPGVTRAWAFENLTQGIPVSVTFVFDGRNDIFPTMSDIADVETYINSQRPVGARFDVFAPIAKHIDLQIAINPNNVAVQQAVMAEVEDFFTRESEPGTTLRLSRLQESISAATGEFYHELILPTNDIDTNESELPVVGSVTWSLAT